VRQAFDQPVYSGSAIFDRCALIVGEWDLSHHALEIVPCFGQLSFARAFWHREITASAGHRMRALLEEPVSTVPMAEIEVLPRRSFTSTARRK